MAGWDVHEFLTFYEQNMGKFYEFKSWEVQGKVGNHGIIIFSYDCKESPQEK